MPALARFNHGTQRLVPPEATLARVTPYLERNGITRAMPITRLDSLGIPSYCAIRPDGLLLQVSNGKGITDVAARVSAVMEALELNHAEHPRPAVLRWTSASALEAEGAAVVRPADVYGFRGGYFSDRFQCEWVEAENLVDGSRAWVPASAVYFFRQPCLHDTTTNGLASGNDLSEATLHAIYEVVERDAMSRLSVDGVMRIRDRALVVDPREVPDDTLAALVDRVERAGTTVVLLWLPSAIALHTFWSVMLNRNPGAAVSTLNVGWGTHVDWRIAASRALTEAAQSRLALIHGAREDILQKPVSRAERTFDSAAVRYFGELEPTATWADVEARPTLPLDDDLDAQLERVVTELARAGHERLLRVDLTDPDANIPVVKIIAPSLQFNRELF